jgi:acetyl esterase/lipase
MRIRGSKELLFIAALVTFSCGGGATVTPPSQPAAPGPVAPCPTSSVARRTEEPSDFESIAAAELAANSKPGARHLPARDVPVPMDDVSSPEQAFIGAPFSRWFAHHPKDAAEWKAIIAKFSEGADKDVAALAAKLHVTITPTTIASVPCFLIAPETIPPKNRSRLLVHVHGGAYVFGAGIGGNDEAVILAGVGGFKVLAIDYRMPPDFPYPAAMDDAIAVWKKAVTMVNPKNMAIFGSSTGGGMTLAMAMRARDEHLPLPAAIAPGTPWADLTDAGDSYKTNEWVDNVLVSARGLLGDAARLYAGGHDLKDPMLSPIYGDFRGLPPAILTSGTRDLFLSNTVRTHRKLRRAGVEADLNVYEGESHAQYYFDVDVPETKEAMGDIASFFDRHLGH